jgi:hypothetical protein
MAKSLRASSRKANNMRLKAALFGPAEQARAERLSAKLMELANEPKPTREIEMKVDDIASDGMLDILIPAPLTSPVPYLTLNMKMASTRRGKQKTKKVCFETRR